MWCLRYPKNAMSWYQKSISVDCVCFTCNCYDRLVILASISSFMFHFKDTIKQVFCTFVKTVLLKIVQNSRGSTCARVSLLIKLQAEAQVFLCEFCKVYKNTFSYRTPLKAASLLISSASKYHYYFCTPGILYIASVLIFRHFFHSIRLRTVFKCDYEVFNPAIQKNNYL